MWNRQVTVEISSDDNSVNMIFGHNASQDNGLPTHRIDFEYHSSMGWAGDYGTITLYNLDRDEIRTLQRKTHGALTIKLSARYEDEGGLSDYLYSSNSVPSTIFVGSITNTVNYQQPPESITHLYCVPQQVNQVTQIGLGNITFQVSQGQTLRDAIGLLAGMAGLGYKVYGLDEDLLNYKFPKGRAFNSTFIQEVQKLCEEFHLNFSLQPAFIEYYPSSIGSADVVNEIAKQCAPIAVTPGTVIGSPVAGLAHLELSVILNPSINTGMLVDITKLITPDGTDATKSYVAFNAGYMSNINDQVLANAMSSLYQIISLVHHGSTHAQNFQTDITANYGVDNTMGSIEREWREWCAQAYG